MSAHTVRIGSHSIELTRTDKVLFPDDGFTKGDLIDYYRLIAPHMVPFLRGRPLMLARYPDGLQGFSFYQKAISDYYPDWIHRVTVSKEGGVVTHVVCDNAATLVYLANQAVVTPHVWLSRADKLNYPDRLVIDLDPPEDDAGLVRWAALAVRDFLRDELGLPSWVMSTGSRGVHLTLPLDRKWPFEQVRQFARAAAERLSQRYPERLTIEARKAKRGQRLLLDVLRNSYGATSVAPYAVRARPGAPVAAPLTWAEVEDQAFHPRRFSLKTMPERPESELAAWSDFPPRGVSLKAAQTALSTVPAL